MLQRSSFWTCIFFTVCIILVKYFTTGLKCELKGLVNNKIRCLLHDRGINAVSEGVINVNGTLMWASEQGRLLPEDLEPWKYSSGLDRDKAFFEGNNANDFKKHVCAQNHGTRWCGDIGGDAPTSYEDLEFFLQTNKCCLLHDACPETLGPQSSKEDISNTGLLTRFHCDCERDFIACLRKLKTGTANKIGFTYFTIFAPQCFRRDSPIINCTRRRGERCLEYRYNRTQEKKYQWFDVPIY